MFQVFVVDDEPSAIDYIRTIVDCRCPGFRVKDTAENGAECLKKMEAFVPDVVISDVKMPVMDGIELIRNIRGQYPQVLTLIISGHQEFEYVRSALQFGVNDYLLKPLVPTAVSEVMERIRVKLEESRRQQRSHALTALAHNRQVDSQRLARLFPEALCDCVLVRRNGLPKRFSRPSSQEVFSDTGNDISVYGRDEMEYICLRPAGDVAAYMQELIAREQGADTYVTAVALREPFRIERLADRLRRLYRALDVKLLLGQTQAVILPETYSTLKLPPDDQDALVRLEEYFKNGMTDKARAKLLQCMKSWSAADMPQLWIERHLRFIVYMAMRAEGGEHVDGISEHLLDDVFASMSSMDELTEYMDEILFGSKAQETENRADTKERFDAIKSYISAHFAEPLTANSVCRHFGISQSYLSKMFRKYEDESFNAYLIQARMECAKRILEEDADARVKDVAALVGYSDPFYFSRAFRAYTGASPKDFILTRRNEQ